MEVNLKTQTIYKMVMILTFCSLFFNGSVFATIGDISKQTENFPAKNKRDCDRKINRFLTEVTPYSLGPDDGSGTRGECMECGEIKRAFKKPPGRDFSKKPICRVVGECVVVEDSFCDGIAKGDGS
jgi:hypothetical protein